MIWTAIWIFSRPILPTIPTSSTATTAKEILTTSPPCRLGVETRYVCWGAGIVDLDNDGYPDMFLVTGNVYPEIEAKLPQYPCKTPRVVFRNLGNGKFEELIEQGGSRSGRGHCSRGCAFGDFDNDGDMDILVVNLNEPPSLLRNDLQEANWLKVKLGESSRTAAPSALAFWSAMAAKYRHRPCLARRAFIPATIRGCISVSALLLWPTLKSIGQTVYMRSSRRLGPISW